MKLINAQTIREMGTFLGLIEGLGYLYQVGAEMFVYNGNGLNKL
jgi:hypothetical protein